MKNARDVCRAAAPNTALKTTRGSSEGRAAGAIAVEAEQGVQHLQPSDGIIKSSGAADVSVPDAAKDQTDPAADTTVHNTNQSPSVTDQTDGDNDTDRDAVAISQHAIDTDQSVTSTDQKDISIDQSATPTY
ncbi:hypothetical protein ON010_g5376 [Phytophthora cinnamomi]|nr:hypothetical protein ON010_g5376 [Phytophthora cinnamomi]